MNAATSPVTAAVLDALVEEGITHVLGIPDNTSAPVFDALPEGNPFGIRLVRVTREGEAFAVAAGLWLGGARPLVLIQNTGLLESGDALRGTATRMGAPIPVVVTGRGYAGMESAGLAPDAGRERELLTRATLDSTALFTEPTLHAWGIPYTRCRDGEDVPTALAGVIRNAHADERPTALLLTAALG